MPRLPDWQVRTCGGESYYAIDWRQAFRSDLAFPGQPTIGDMRGFHVVFRLRVELGGTLVFLATDGCIIRRNGEVVHEDREIHPPERHELHVSTGDRLDIAQWQHGGDWMWGVRQKHRPSASDGEAIIGEYADAIEAALRRPNGPVLKVYTSARDPLRCALSVHSMVLNGYRPSGIQVYGDYQWDDAQRDAIQRLLPFADIVSLERVRERLDALDERLLPRAREMWLIMKTCVCLFMPPHEFCYLDDDIFVLDRIDDALALHATHDLVFAPDEDYDADYRAIWCPSRTEPLSTGRVNAAFYLLRNRTNLAAQVERFLATPPPESRKFVWEQGFVATEFADLAIGLSAQRYFYPLFEGLPGGLLGYDWLANPCEFTTVHFGGPRPKPADLDVLPLIREILGRRCAA